MFANRIHSEIATCFDSNEPSGKMHQSEFSETFDFGVVLLLVGLVTENRVLPNDSPSNLLFLHIVQTEFCQHFIFRMELSSVIVLHFIVTVLDSFTFGAS